MKKRAREKLVESGIVRGWDALRLYTLVTIHCGIPASTILSFISELGVTTALGLI